MAHAHCHVPADREAQAAEHLDLGDSFDVVERFPDQLRELLVVRHGRDIVSLRIWQVVCAHLVLGDEMREGSAMQRLAWKDLSSPGATLASGVSAGSLTGLLIGGVGGAAMFF